MHPGHDPEGGQWDWQADLLRSASPEKTGMLGVAGTPPPWVVAPGVVRSPSALGNTTVDFGMEPHALPFDGRLSQESLSFGAHGNAMLFCIDNVGVAGAPLATVPLLAAPGSSPSLSAGHTTMVSLDDLYDNLFPDGVSLGDVWDDIPSASSAAAVTTSKGSPGSEALPAAFSRPVIQPVVGDVGSPLPPTKLDAAGTPPRPRYDPAVIRARPLPAAPGSVPIRWPVAAPGHAVVSPPPLVPMGAPPAAPVPNATLSPDAFSRPVIHPVVGDVGSPLPPTKRLCSSSVVLPVALQRDAAGTPPRPRYDPAVIRARPLPAAPGSVPIRWPVAAPGRAVASPPPLVPMGAPQHALPIDDPDLGLPTRGAAAATLAPQAGPGPAPPAPAPVPNATLSRQRDDCKNRVTEKVEAFLRELAATLDTLPALLDALEPPRVRVAAVKARLDAHDAKAKYVLRVLTGYLTRAGKQALGTQLTADVFRHLLGPKWQTSLAEPDKALLQKHILKPDCITLLRAAVTEQPGWVCTSLAAFC
jgi:hypothetical protein